MLSRRLDLGADRVGRVPGVVADRERVAGVGRELHLRRLGQRAVGRAVVEDRADMRAEVVARQVELHRHALPLRVGVRGDAIARNVAGQHRDRIHAEFCDSPAPKRRSSPGASRRMNASCTSAEHSARPTRSQIARFASRQVAGVFGEQVDLDPRRGAVLADIAPAAAGQRPIVGRLSASASIIAA